jgi:hypothetical protein
MFVWLTKLLPFLPSLLEKVLPGQSARAEELKAEKELIEAKAFARGRISPKYCFYFLVVGVFAVYAVMGVVDAIFPGAVSLPFKAELLEIVKLGHELFGE